MSCCFLCLSTEESFSANIFLEPIDVLIHLPPSPASWPLLGIWGVFGFLLIHRQGSTAPRARPGWTQGSDFCLVLNSEDNPALASCSWKAEPSGGSCPGASFLPLQLVEVTSCEEVLLGWGEAKGFTGRMRKGGSPRGRICLEISTQEHQEK